MRTNSSRLLSILSLAALTVSHSASAQEALAALAAPKKSGEVARRVTGYEMLGETSFPTSTVFAGTTLGGLSGITYDARSRSYHAISDDRSQLNPARFYTMEIGIGDGVLSAGDVVFKSVTTLKNAANQPFPALSLDPEGIALTPRRTLLVSSEGDAIQGIAPFVREFTLAGRQIADIPVPAKYNPTSTTGIRNNLAFESLSIRPDGEFAFTATENALLQDGPAATPATGSLSRILKFNLSSHELAGEFVYPVEPVADAPIPAGSFSTNGLVELLALDNNGSFLALERSFSTGVGNTVRLYLVRTQGALDVSALNSLVPAGGSGPYEIDPPVSKELILDVADLGVIPDNLEGMTLGPKLPDGRQSLIIVADNNFAATQVTQFIALALDFKELPVVLPTLETPTAINDEDSDSDLLGDSDDPAIWQHPTRRERSLVICAQKDGGAVVFDLHGEIVQRIAPAEYGGLRYNNVDLLYGLRLNGKRTDVAVFSDRENDTLAAYAIDPVTGVLSDVTSPQMPASIFGVDDGDHTAYGLATYSRPQDGDFYAFVSQRSGNGVAQLKLEDDGSGKVKAGVVRSMQLPVPTGDPEESQSEGMVVDRDRGILYIALEAEGGLYKIGAEPGDGSNFTLIYPLDSEFFKADIEGLTMYYGADGSGYLLVSSQGDNTFAAFDREGDNDYLGSFTVGDRKDIDQTNESDGADVLNVNLGPSFPRGLLVVQDGANDPQVLFDDDGELENVSTNFKFVPWQNVAGSFEEQLDIDPVSENPRGTIEEQLGLMEADVVTLLASGELAAQDAVTLRGVLKKVADAVEDGNERKAASLLVDFRDETRRAREKRRMEVTTEAYLNGGANLLRDLVEESGN